MNKELNGAYHILKKVCIDKSYVSIELNKYLKGTHDINTALITKIVYGVLEKDITLEYFIQMHTKKLPKPNILLLLKIVAYASKTISSIPSFALVNEIVEMAKKEDKYSAGFVNAVSKKLIASDIVLPSKKDYVKYLSVKYSYPEWVIRELQKSKDNTFIEDLLSTNLNTLTHIRVNESKISADDFKAKLDKLEIKYEQSLYNYTMYVDYAKLLKEKELKDLYVVQGLPSIITCNVLCADKGKVLDVCAAPGGKSVYLAQNSNLDVFSCDIYAHRLDLVKKYARNYDIHNIHFCLQDGTIINDNWIDKFDYVLCDVPCSNLGVSRKKPDVFLNKSLNDAKMLAGIQYKILETSANYVKKGGILQYSTCTIIDLENKNVIEKFLKNHKDFELTEIKVEGINIYNDNNLYTFYPNLTGTEGFFIARLRRK